MTPKQVGGLVTNKRPSSWQCLCGELVSNWYKNWCGNEYTEETCPKCGRVYAATTGELKRGKAG